MATRRSMLKSASLFASVLLTVALVPVAAQAEPTQSIAQVEARIAQIGHEAEVASEAYNEAQEQETATQRELDTIRATVAEQQESVRQLQGRMSSFAAAAYRSGGMDSTLGLMLSDDPETFLAQASTLDSFSRSQSDSLHQINVAKRKLASSEKVAAQQLETLTATREQMGTQKSAVEAKLAEQQRVLDGLKAEQRRELEQRRQQAAAEANARAQARAAQLAASRAERTTATIDVPASGRGAGALRFALAQVGKPYRWGAVGPDAYDCSGLTMAAFRSVGVSLPHHSGSQIRSGTRVSRDQLQPGDLLFFYSPISHVSIYMGGGQMVHASTSGSPVKISPVNWGNFVGATRI